MVVGSGSDYGGSFFFNSTTWARQRRADAMEAGLGKLKLEPQGTKHDEV
jgi:hypothetical protein